MTYHNTGPLLPRPQAPNPTIKTFRDVDDRAPQTLEVTTVDECAAFLVLGKMGGIKGSAWLSPDDALALADMLIARYRR